MNTDEQRTWGTRIIRYSLIVVLFYFGISQLVSPINWTGWLPTWTSAIPIAPVTLIIMNGVFEVILALALLLGIYTRIVAVIAALHLAAITLDIGFTEIGVRDFGLTMATIALAFFGPDSWTIDSKRSKK